MNYHRPRTLAEVWRLREADAKARYIAGGTDLQIGRWAPEDRPSSLISLSAVPELAGIAHGKPTRIGALTLVADIAAHEGLAAAYPALAAAAGRLGSPQIRNAATLGGNLCRAAPEEWKLFGLVDPGIVNGYFMLQLAAQANELRDGNLLRPGNLAPAAHQQFPPRLHHHCRPGQRR